MFKYIYLLKFKVKSAHYLYDIDLLLQAEARAEFAEKTVKKLQKEVDRLEGKSYDLVLKTISIKQNNFIKMRVLFCEFNEICAAIYTYALLLLFV